MKISVDTGKLSLPGPSSSGDFVASPHVPQKARDDAIAALRALGLTQIELDQLLARIPDACTVNKLVDTWPNQGDDNKALKAAADLAQGLAIVLAGLSPKARAELAHVSNFSLRDVNAAGNLIPTLNTLAGGLQHRISQLPKQSRAKPRTNLVRLVYELQSDRLGVPNKWSESPFYKACQQIFVLAGQATFPANGGEAKPYSPDRAIEALTKWIAKTG